MYQKIYFCQNTLKLFLFKFSSLLIVHFQPITGWHDRTFETTFKHEVHYTNTFLFYVFKNFVVNCNTYLLAFHNKNTTNLHMIKVFTFQLNLIQLIKFELVLC